MKNELNLKTQGVKMKNLKSVLFVSFAIVMLMLLLTSCSRSSDKILYDDPTLIQQGAPNASNYDDPQVVSNDGNILIHFPVISGYVFFDIDCDGEIETDETGFAGVGVSLFNENGVVVYETITDENGYYEFTVFPGIYEAEVEDISADVLTSSTGTTIAITIGFVDIDHVDFGFCFDVPEIEELEADTYTIGFWKNNLRKGMNGQTNGIQIDVETLEFYVSILSDFALEPLNPHTLEEAYDFMNTNDNEPVALLSKQLMASEFNYVHGGFIDGNEEITYLFIYWGEYLVANYLDFSSEYLLYAKDWFDAYNNAHGGPIQAP